MNCYTVTPGRIKPGIATTDGCILVGEDGRGRKLVRVPIPAKIVADGETLMESPLRDDGDVLLLVEDHSGYRGGWKLLAPRPPAGYDAIVRRDQAHALAIRASMAAMDVVDGHVTYGDCPACAAVEIPDRLPAQWRVVAEGACAQGDAGRMGGGPAYLLVLPVGAALQINRGGRLYGEPSTLLVRNAAGVITITDPLADAESRLAIAGGAW